MKPEISEKGILNLGRHVLLEEAKELEAIAGRLDETFVKAVRSEERRVGKEC